MAMYELDGNHLLPVRLGRSADAITLSHSLVAIQRQIVDVLRRPLFPLSWEELETGASLTALDATGHDDVAILAYSAKYASAFYGPFREAVGSSLQGDRRTYQQDPANRREGLREALLDLAEGADMVMVKPASHYLDVLADVAAVSKVPVAAYQVSGEYAMIEAAAEHGWIDRRAAIEESITSIVRSGADVVLTYWALEVAEWLD